MLARTSAVFAQELARIPYVTYRYNANHARNNRPYEPIVNPTVIMRERVYNPFRVVPQASFALRERFEKYQNKKEAGLNFIFPFINHIVYIPKSEIMYGVTHQEAITQDNASVSADGVFYFKVVDPVKAAYNVNDLQTSLINLVVTNLRAVMGSMDLDKLLSGRKEINRKLEEVIKPAAAEWGVEVTRVEIKEIKPDPNLVHAMDQQMTAEREKRATITTAEAKKEAAIREAEGRKESLIRDAEGKLEAAKLEAKARLELAKADAESLKAISEATQHDPVNYMIAKDNVKALQALAASPNKTYMLQNSSSFFTAPLAAAMEMLRVEPEANPKLKQ